MIKVPGGGERGERERGVLVERNTQQINKHCKKTKEQTRQKRKYKPFFSILSGLQCIK